MPLLFGVVDRNADQAKKLEEHMDNAMDTTLSIMEDLMNSTEQSPGDHSGIENSLTQVMSELINIEADVKSFLQAIAHMKRKAQSQEEECDPASLMSLMEECYKTVQSEQLNMEDHTKYKALQTLIWENKHPDQLMPSNFETELDDGEMIMSQQVNTLDPITKQDMVDPVRNAHCGHTYDKTSISHYIKDRRGRAKCPIVGCGNTIPLQLGDLTEDKAMKRVIDKKNNKANPR